MRTNDLVRDVYAIALFAYAECIAFMLLATFDSDHIERRARDMLHIFIGGLVCHAMVRAVHSIYHDDVLTMDAGPA